MTLKLYRKRIVGKGGGNCIVRGTAQLPKQVGDSQAWSDRLFYQDWLARDLSVIRKFLLPGW